MPKIKSRPCFLTPRRLNHNYPLFVFLPGMDGTGQLLRTQTEGLEVAFDVRCLAIPADDLTNWEDLAQIVVNLIEKEIKKQPTRSVYLCGESFGGCLALKVALKSPQLFDKIILINPATSFPHRPWLGWGGKLSSFFPEYVYRLSTIALLPFLSNLARIPPSDRRALLNAMRSIPPETVTWRVSMVSEFDIGETQLQGITQPVLLIAGGADLLLPSVEEVKRLVNDFPNAKMIVLPQCGHTCLLESDVHLFQIMKEQNFLDASVQNLGVKSVLMPMLD
jgi:pimeloyl-ACP methyl ester carboxylesterase